MITNKHNRIKWKESNYYTNEFGKYCRDINSEDFTFNTKNGNGILAVFIIAKCGGNKYYVHLTTFTYECFKDSVCGYPINSCQYSSSFKRVSNAKKAAQKWMLKLCTGDYYISKHSCGMCQDPCYCYLYGIKFSFKKNELNKQIEKLKPIILIKENFELEAEIKATLDS